MSRAFAWVIIAYSVAAVVALSVGYGIRLEHPIIVAATADVVATIAIFLFSFTFGNSSFYDPYWSVAPVPIALYWGICAGPGEAEVIRQFLVVALVILWSVRLTSNWARGWEGLQHEDWRYVGMRSRSGRAYWPVSFLGIHMTPTIWVFVGCLSLYPAVSSGARPLGVLDALAVFVTGGAIWIEARADKELRHFRRSEREPEAILSTGLWAYSRHPNYFGEMGFWWGLYLFGLAAAPAYWWTIVGPLAITLMFWFISLPMIEDRMLERRPGFAKHIERTSLVIPWFPAGRKAHGPGH
jgi:steroid 5-alpha reductase family enzyme